MPLSDTAVRQAKPTDKPRKLPDEKGLYLLLTLSGGKLWRYEQKTLVIHNTDEVSFQQVWAVLGQAMHLPIQICRQCPGPDFSGHEFGVKSCLKKELWNAELGHSQLSLAL